MNKLILLLMSFILTACMGTKAPVTCSELSDRYASLGHLSIKLDTAKGYEELTEYIFKYDSIYKFNEDIDTYLLYLELLKVKKVDNAYINPYCQHINNTVQENNITIMEKELKEIKYSWTVDYIEKINKSSTKYIKFNIVNGCEKIASDLEEYMRTFKIDMSSDIIYNLMKKEYDTCLIKNKK